MISSSPGRYALIISDTIDFANLEDALTKTNAPGAADKVIVTID